MEHLDRIQKINPVINDLFFCYLVDIVEYIKRQKRKGQDKVDF